MKVLRTFIGASGRPTRLRDVVGALVLLFVVVYEVLLDGPSLLAYILIGIGLLGGLILAFDWRRIRSRT
jgi:hypothetical protein